MTPLRWAQVEGALGAFRDPSFAYHPASTLCSTTILMGAEYRLYPVDRMMPLARLLAHASMKVIHACGDLAPLVAPEQVVSALRELKVLIEQQQM